MTIKKIFSFALLPLMMFGGCKKDKDNDKDPIVNSPTIVSSSPTDNATGVSSAATIEFTFSEPMDPLTISNTTITLFKGNTQKSGTITYIDNTATFTPSSALVGGTVYTALVSTGAQNVAGAALKTDFSITFTTAGPGDNVAPLINSTNPMPNAIGVERNKTVSVIFNEPMDPTTINTTTFTLKKGTVTVVGIVAYADNIATFTSSANLESNTIYTATITAGVQDLSENELVADNEWSFTTGMSAATLAVVDLGGAGNYVILAKTAINNSSTSALVGDLGLSPSATSFVTGLSLVNATGFATSSQVTGNVYAADMAAPTPVTLTTAVNDMITAYNDASGRPTPDFLELGTGNIGGKTLTAGLYKWTSTVTIPADLTLTGGANDVWIFQIAGDLTQSSAINITLNGGAQAKNIFWQVAGEATLGANSHFEGNILSMTGITFLTGASMNGRALAQTAVILDANAVTKAQ